VRKRFEDADELYGKLLTLIDDSPEWRSDWHWILSNSVEYFRSRGKGDLVAHLTAKENEHDAYGDFVRKKLEHAERTLPDNDPELADAMLAIIQFSTRSMPRLRCSCDVLSTQTSRRMAKKAKL
jgi:hypothetical protein